MFVPQPDDLNKEQWAAVEETESLLLVACPGSGKTRTLTYKIAMELSRLRTHRDTVIAITYTNAAAEEIKDRIEKLGAPTEQLWIGTIHSFCLEWILRPYALYHEALAFGFTVLDAAESEITLEHLCKPYASQDITHYDCSYYAEPSGYVKESPSREKWPYIDKVLEQYWATLRANRQIDFEQILGYSYELIQKVPVITQVLSQLFPFVFVDEYQDTKSIQYEIVFSILRQGAGKNKLLIVGDPNQSIFETLGGFPMEKEAMEKRLGFTLKQLPLSGNYRSSKIIVDYFDGFKTFDNTVVAVGLDAAYPSLITYDHVVSKDNLLDEIVRLIQYNIETIGISPDEICIAGPQWFPLASLSRDLMARLPDLSFDGPGMAPFARDIENFWYKIARILLTEPSPDLYVRRLRWATEILAALQSAGIDTSHLDHKKFLRLCNGLVIEEDQGIPFLEKGFAALMVLLKIDLLSCKLLAEHHAAFFESAKRRVALLESRHAVGISSLANFKNVFRQKGGIKISSIHGIKGTEFDVVIGFGLLNSWVPHFKDNNGTVNSKKMMYVLGSRARKNLHLFSETGRQVNQRNPRGLLPTPCLIGYHYAYTAVPS